MQQLKLLLKLDNDKECLIVARNQITRSFQLQNILQANALELMAEAQNQCENRTFKIQLLANYFTTDSSRSVNSQRLIELLSNFAPLQTDNQKHAFAILSNNIIRQCQQDPYGDNLVLCADQIVQQLDDENIIIACKNDITFELKSLDRILDALTALDKESEIELSKGTLLYFQHYFAETFQINFEHSDLDIPKAQEAVKKELSESEIQQFIQEMVISDNQSQDAPEGNFYYLSQRDQERCMANNKCMMEALMKRCHIDETTKDRLSFILQILEQYLSVEPSGWKSKQICDTLFPYLAFILHYQVKYQPQERGRFAYFFDFRVPKLRVTILKIFAHVSDLCPCAWDLNRIFGILEMFAIGYMGDGEAVGAKEVSIIGLRNNCEYSPENVQYLRRFTFDTSKK